MTTTLTAGPAVSAGPARPQRRRRTARKWVEIALFAGPATIVFVTFVIVPVVLAGVYSLYNWTGYGPLTDFVGLDNFVEALTHDEFQLSIRNNFFIVFASLLIQGPLAVAAALLLNHKLRGRAFIRAAVFVPYVLAEATAGIAWKALLSPYGTVNATLEAIGLGDWTHTWLGDEEIVLWVMFGLLTWKYLGLAIIIMLAGLQGIPEELHEAAAIDGAGWWKSQLYITLPLLGPTIRIWAFLSIVGSLQQFDMVWVTTGGGPFGQTSTMALYMYVWGNQRLGYGSAVAVIMFVISLVVALLYQRLAMRRDLEGAVTRGVR